MSGTTKTTSKRAQLTARLSRKDGATLAQLTKTLGWQPHTVRAAMSRLRKAGYAIERVEAPTPGGPARWRITARPEAE